LDSSESKNFRVAFINDNVNYCVDHWEDLTDWEKGFIGNVQNIPAENWSQPRFETLQKIVPALKERILGL